MSELYCLKCKSHTQTSNPQVTTIQMHYKKGARAGQSITRHAVVGHCSVCGTKKQKFVKSEAHGNGILGTLLGLPGGKIPVVSDIPLLGTLF